MPLNRQILGIDVGGTNIAFGKLQTSGTGSRFKANFVDCGELPVTAVSLSQFENQLEQIIDQHGPFDSLGIGVPAVVNNLDGALLSSVHLDFLNGVALLPRLRKRWNLPVSICNDGNFAALSEAYDDSLELVEKSVFCITVGTGIGSGYALDGKLQTGRQTSGFELGHTLVACDLINQSPTKQKSPHRDALESWVSGSLLDNMSRQAGYGDSGEAAQAARSGDLEAKAIFEQLGGRLGIGIATAISLYEPDVVAIGGGASRAGELLLKPARETARNLLLAGLGTQTKIRLAKGGPEAGWRGAAISAYTKSPEAIV